jgi:hypothetical protein
VGSCNGPYAAEASYAGDEERGYGWVLFAGTLLLMLGTLNFIEGLAAIGNSHFSSATCTTLPAA